MPRFNLSLFGEPTRAVNNDGSDFRRPEARSANCDAPPSPAAVHIAKVRNLARVEISANALARRSAAKEGAAAGPRLRGAATKCVSPFRATRSLIHFVGASRHPLVVPVPNRIRSMKLSSLVRSLALPSLILVSSACSEGTPDATPKAPPTKKQAAPPPLDPNNIVSIASGSKDHSTLVAALQAADYVRSVANPGPLTVFAPTNAAFAKLPAGTVEGLLEPAKADALRDLLKYHVAAAVYEAKDLADGMQLGMANMQKVTIKKQNGKVTVNGANIVASIRASNGIVHVLDGVLLPPQ